MAEIELRASLFEAGRLAALSAEVSHALAEGGSLRSSLQRYVEALVRHVDAALARIWLMDETNTALVLHAHAGIDSGVAGRHERLPIDESAIGRIAKEAWPHLTNAVSRDARVHEQEWAVRAGMVAFAAYPLMVEGGVVGMLAIYSRHPLSEPCFDAMGMVASMIAHDIRRKRAEEALRRTNDELRGLVAASPLAIVGIGAAGDVLSWNAAAERMFGWRADEVLGRRLPNVPPERQDEFDRFRANVLAGQAFSDVESQRQTKDGALLDVSISTAALHDERGHVSGLVALYGDITGRKRAEQELQASQEQFRHAQKLEAVGRLAGGIAHDFNNLLAAILSTIELVLVDAEEHTPLWTDLKEIERSTHRASRLTRQLLAFSRNQVLQPRVLDLNAVVADMGSILRRVIGEDVELVTVPESGLGSVRADPGQLEQVLMNLAVNARDAMPEGGTLTISTGSLDVDLPRHGAEFILPAGAYAIVTVRDTGVGMDAATLAHAFEPFFTTKEREKGSGLGLSTVYGIVKQSGGFIDVSSEPGRGAAFTIYLPRVTGSPEELAVPVRSTASAHGSETVLIAEDERLVRTGARRALLRHGYQVLEAGDPDEALIIAAQYPGSIDLLLTDMIMPKMSGRELAERLVKSRPELRVLYTSGYTDDELGRHGTLPVGMHFLPKPFTLNELTRKVRDVLDGIGAVPPHNVVPPNV